MRVPLGWLSEWIDLPERPEELAERLTFAGLEIESIERSGADLSALRVGQVQSCEPHPNADRLSLCTVDLGSGEPVAIVCGAPNVAAGQRVAVASPGTTLPDGTRLKKTKIRGVASHGMICSERELGLGPGEEGILVLPEGAPLGAPLPEVLPSRDTVLDVEITPNRGDWASLLGIAREVRAHYGGALRLPECQAREDGLPASGDVEIAIEVPEDCFRYLGRVVRGVRLGPSPDWLAAKLESAGLRAINVVVDVTNLVMLEFGQPLHAFDLATLRGRQVRVRRARPDEKLATLDGQMRELGPEDLVIADAERPIAVAGVIGGAETEVRDETTEVLLECAHFHPTRVRKTARRLGLHSDAAYRFERGVDPLGLERAVDRAAGLLAELAGGSVARGTVEARGAAFPHQDELLLEPDHVNRLLGTELSAEEVVELLARVDVEARGGLGGRLRCSIPSYRNDLEIPVDLVEEVARTFGYDRIPQTLPAAPLATPAQPPRHLLELEVRDSLRASGLLEMRVFPAGPADDADGLRLPPDDPRRRSLVLQNPLLGDFAHMYTSLVPSLLRAVRHNLAHQVERVPLFQVARHFRPGGEGELPHEPPVAAGALTTGDHPGLWHAKAPLLFQVKGIVERLLVDLGRTAEFRPECDESWLHPGAACSVWLGSKRLGALGELHPAVAEHFEIDAPCAVFELDLEPLLAEPPPVPRYREISRQPAVRRDIAVLVDRDRPAGQLLEALRRTGGKHLMSVELFDRYEGKGVPEGKLSLAFRLVLQRPDRALTDAEISKLIDRLSQLLVRRFGAEFR